MPPKTQYTFDNIVEAAFQVVRRRGIEKLSARGIAEQMGSSTMPIYSSIKSMNALHGPLMKRAGEIALSYQTTTRTGDVFRDMWIGYVLFAREEKHLFRFFNDARYTGVKKELNADHLNSLADILAESPRAEGLSQAECRLMVLKGWIFTHGLADLLDNSSNPVMASLRLDDRKLLNLLEEVDVDLSNSSHESSTIIFPEETEKV